MKDFDGWNKEKKKTSAHGECVLPKKREIWWAKIGINIGVEEDGKNNLFERPVLVIKVFSRESFLGVPITSVDKTNKKYYFKIRYNDKDYFLILSQIRLMSTKRLLRIITKIESDVFLEVKEVLQKVIGI